MKVRCYNKIRHYGDKKSLKTEQCKVSHQILSDGTYARVRASQVDAKPKF